MFADGYFSLSFAEALGLSVTIVSVYFVIVQLRETRLASQMEGMISLANFEASKRMEAKALTNLITSEEWEKLTAEESFALIKENEGYWDGALNYSEAYELIGNLAKSGALDINIAYEQFGWSLPSAYRQLEKAIDETRKEFGPELQANWEWLTIEFEKMSA